MKVADITETTHNPLDESHTGELLAGKPPEQFLWGGAGNGPISYSVPRQSLTRQVFHKILKSGCQAEQSKLRTAERLVNLLATFCILSWRIFWLTMLNRSTKKAKATLAFTPLEIELLNRLAPERRSAGSVHSLHSCLVQLARLGGYLNRAGDAPPGNTVIWRGMSRLTDIEIGYLIGAGNMGN